LEGRERAGGLQVTFSSTIPSWQLSQSVADGQIDRVESCAPA
jgi:hypothetical protein